jgi:ATP-dependent exoDNAse (exonuclease V) beta subunit
MHQVRNMFETDLELFDGESYEGDQCNYDSKLLKEYSVFQYIPKNFVEYKKKIEQLIKAYSEGCKLFIVVDNQNILSEIAKLIDGVLAQKGLTRKGMNLSLKFEEGDPSPTEYNKLNFNCCNCNIYTTDMDASNNSIPEFSIRDGIMTDIQKHWITELSRRSGFNVEQYIIEHIPIDQNVLIRAGAGTGKTYTMISRVSYISYAQNLPLSTLSKQLVMITFTNEAADSMKAKLKNHFMNYYLITANTEFIKLVNQIDNMQISTIHMYAKKIISALGIEFGYGKDIAITAGEFKIKKIIKERVNSYIKDKKRTDLHFTEKLGIPMYVIENFILNIITKLHDKSIDITELEAEAFGKPKKSENVFLHELILTTIPLIENEYVNSLIEDNKMHLGTMMSMLNKFVGNPANKERLKDIKQELSQFMFVDEFQDTDDVQIDALCRIADHLNCKLFVVGDIKQCIYRFRGAEEKAFDRLILTSKRKWKEVTLVRNYRSDKYLLGVFQEIFENWSSEGQLLAYNKNTDELYSNLSFNENEGKVFSQDKYFKEISINNQNERMSSLFAEVDRIKRRIEWEKGKAKNLSKDDKTIAILVRENWQADIVRSEGAKKGYKVQTSTGGNLYQSTAALDMLVLVNALLHYNEADYLYPLVISNFFDIKVSKTQLYNIKSKLKSKWRMKANTKSLSDFLIQENINTVLLRNNFTWEQIIGELRVKPILQIIKELYSSLRPWCNYSDNLDEQRQYRFNIDLLLEEIINSCSIDSLSVNTLAEYLHFSISTKRKVEERSSIDNESEEDIVIKCITVHKSKGMEYGHVVLPYASFVMDKVKNTDLHLTATPNSVGYSLKIAGSERVENDKFSTQIENTERSKEEARVLYVAMTRAIRSFSYIAVEGQNSLNWQSLIRRRSNHAL